MVPQRFGVAGLLLLFVALEALHPACAGADDAAAPTTAPAPIARHVLLVGIDGARADAIRDHPGPAMRSLIRSGTVCWQAEAVLPSVTQVNWASILTGCSPSRHGIDRHPISEEELSGVRVKVPTLFDLVARSGRHAAGFIGHWKLHPVESSTPGALVRRSPYEAQRVAPLAAKYIEQHRPAFCFVWFGNLDGIGHQHGWMSEPYLNGIAEIDAGIATLLGALDRAGIREQTLVILTSDHGGHDRGHGQGTRQDVLVPWIASGPGIRGGHEIPRPVSNLDTAPTILRALGLPIPPECDGKVVEESIAADEAPRGTKDR